VNIFQVTRAMENVNFKSDIGNVHLLSHASRVENFVGILSRSNYILIINSIQWYMELLLLLQKDVCKQSSFVSLRKYLCALSLSFLCPVASSDVVILLFPMALTL